MPPVNVDAVLALAVVRFVRQLDDCELPDEALTFTKKRRDWEPMRQTAGPRFRVTEALSKKPQQE